MEGSDDNIIGKVQLEGNKNDDNMVEIIIDEDIQNPLPESPEKQIGDMFDEHRMIAIGGMDDDDLSDSELYIKPPDTPINRTPEHTPRCTPEHSTADNGYV